MTKANTFMYASWIGPIGFALFAASTILAPASGLHVIGGFCLILGGIILLITRNADEFTRALWNSGASMAFAALLVLYLGIPFAEGMYDGFTDSERSSELGAEIAVLIAISAFSIGLFWKRFRGDA